MKRLVCFFLGHMTRFVHPQQSVTTCARCDYIVNRRGWVVDIPLQRRVRNRWKH